MAKKRGAKYVAAPLQEEKDELYFFYHQQTLSKPLPIHALFIVDPGNKRMVILNAKTMEVAAELESSMPPSSNG